MDLKNKAGYFAKGKLAQRNRLTLTIAGRR